MRRGLGAWPDRAGGSPGAAQNPEGVCNHQATDFVAILCGSKGKPAPRPQEGGPFYLKRYKDPQ